MTLQAENDGGCDQWQCFHLMRCLTRGICHGDMLANIMYCVDCGTHNCWQDERAATGPLHGSALAGVKMQCKGNIRKLPKVVRQTHCIAVRREDNTVSVGHLQGILP